MIFPDLMVFNKAMATRQKAKFYVSGEAFTEVVASTGLSFAKLQEQGIPKSQIIAAKSGGDQPVKLSTVSAVISATGTVLSDFQAEGAAERFEGEFGSERQISVTDIRKGGSLRPH